MLYLLVFKYQYIYRLYIYIIHPEQIRGELCADAADGRTGSRCYFGAFVISGLLVPPWESDVQAGGDGPHTAEPDEVCRPSFVPVQNFSILRRRSIDELISDVVDGAG